MVRKHRRLWRVSVPWTVALALAPFPVGHGEAQQGVVTLDQAVQQALARDPAAVAAQAAVSVARADLLQTRGAWLPSLSVAGAYGNSSNQRFDQATGQLVSQSYTAQLQSSFEVFSGGRRLANQRAAGAEVEATEAQYRAQRFQTVLETTQAFYAAAAAADLLRAAEQRLVRARQQLAFAETRLELGTVTRSDVLRAELELGDAELLVFETESALRTSVLELGRRVGVNQEVYPAPGALPDQAPALPPPEVLEARAAQSAPAVVAAEALRTSRHAQRLAAYTPYLPTVRLSGGYDWFAFTFPPSQRSWSLRLFASLPILNGFQREASLQRALAAERAAEARARDAAIAVRVAVETAVQAIAVAERRVIISARAVELAREDLRVQEERYQIGAATILDLQASQIALTEAEVSSVRAREALGSAVARLEAVLGTRLVVE